MIFLPATLPASHVGALAFVAFVLADSGGTAGSFAILKAKVLFLDGVPMRKLRAAPVILNLF